MKVDYTLIILIVGLFALISMDMSKELFNALSCYGAKDVDDCKTCDDVIDAYNKKKWVYNKANFIQCKV
jgi:hypothetical protein